MDYDKQENKLNKFEKLIYRDDKFERKTMDILETVFAKFCGIIAFVISFVIVSFLTKSCTYALSNYVLNNHKLTKEELKLVEDASFVYGFYYVNTHGLVSYCSDTNYIPELYIGVFKGKFEKIMDKSESYLIEKLSAEEFEALRDSLESESIIINDANVEVLRNTYPQLTKEDYCESFDIDKDSIVEEKVKVFKSRKPNIEI